MEHEISSISHTVSQRSARYARESVSAHPLQTMPVEASASTSCREHRKVHSRRRCSLCIGCMQLSLCILITTHCRDKFAEAAAFISISSPNRIGSGLLSRVVDEAANILNHDTEVLPSRDSGTTDSALNQLMRGDSANHGTTQQIAYSTTDLGEAQTDLHSKLSIYGELSTKEHANNSKRLQQNETMIEKSTFQRAQPRQRRAMSGLSRTHQSLLSKTSHMRRQRFVTGKYPLYVEVKQNPTKKWLGLAESRIYLNGTSLEKSLASYDIFHWLTNTERQELHGDYEFLSVELLAEIHVKKPGYVNILPKKGAGKGILKSEEVEGMFSWKNWKSRKLDEFVGNDALDEEGERLWVTGFSLTKPRGEIHTVDVDTGEMSRVNDRTARAIKWPNEVASIPTQVYNGSSCNCTKLGIDLTNANREGLEDALLVTDGFLVPGKDKGGLYVVRNPGNALSESRVCLTDVRNFRDITINGEDDWFYHRAIWMDLTGDGRQSILAARAKLPSILNGKNQQAERNRALGKGQLVWLERPMPHSFDNQTGTPLDVDGTLFDPFSARNTPWKIRVLDEGPDVMFNVADLDTMDDTVEVIASQFFSKKLSLHSIRKGPNPTVVFRRVIDDRCGSAFSSILADLDGTKSKPQTDTAPVVVDNGSTVVSLKSGETFSHLLVTSHECSVGQDQETATYGSEVTVGDNSLVSSLNGQSKIDGGSLFGYRVPLGPGAWKTQPWKRSVIATGFKVQGQLSNMINPGAPGFCYTFFPTKDEADFKRGRKWSRPLIGLSGDCAESAYILRPIESAQHEGRVGEDESTKYALMCEIKCKATVGSLAIGYDNFYSTAAEQQTGYAKIYVPCYEQDKVLVFALGSGENDEIVDDW